MINNGETAIASLFNCHAIRANYSLAIDQWQTLNVVTAALIALRYCQVTVTASSSSVLRLGYFSQTKISLFSQSQVVHHVM